MKWNKCNIVNCIVLITMLFTQIINIMSKELKSQFTEEFFEEFQYDAEFRSIFFGLEKGMTPFKAIEHLCKSKKEMVKTLEQVLENMPRKILVTTEEFERIRKEL